eukprot:scaffold33568_cov81-Phaeocystis_antarctica.AAC.1
MAAPAAAVSRATAARAMATAAASVEAELAASGLVKTAAAWAKAMLQWPGAPAATAAGKQCRGRKAALASCVGRYHARAPITARERRRQRRYRRGRGC